LQFAGDTCLSTQIYGYWNQGGLDNVTAMLAYLVDQYFLPTGLPLPALVETPATGAPRSAQSCFVFLIHVHSIWRTRLLLRRWYESTPLHPMHWATMVTITSTACSSWKPGCYCQR